PLVPARLHRTESRRPRSPAAWAGLSSPLPCFTVIACALTSTPSVPGKFSNDNARKRLLAGLAAGFSLPAAHLGARRRNPCGAAGAHITGGTAVDAADL